MRRFLRFRYIAALILILGIIIFTQAGNALSWTEKLEPADAILVIGGGGVERIDMWTKLMKENYAPLLIISGWSWDKKNSSEAQTMATQAEKLGVDTHQIVLETDSSDTYENLLFTKDIIKEHNIKNIILVSSNYHQRRVVLTAKHVWEDLPIHIQSIGAPSSAFHQNTWWDNEDSRYFVLSEWGKIIYSMFTGRYYKITKTPNIPRI